MPLKWNHVPVPLSGGVDTRTDPKVVSPPKLGVCENAVFTTPGQVRKRNGSSLIAALEAGQITVGSGRQQSDLAITSGRTIATRGDELVMLDNRGLLGASLSTGKWTRRTGIFGPGAVAPAAPSLRQVPKLRQDMTLADRATTNGMTAYAWATDKGAVNATVVNAATGEVIAAPVALAATGTRPRVLASGTTFVFLWVNESAGTITFYSVDSQAIVAGGLNPSPAVQVASDLNTSTPVYDAVLSGSRVLIAYNTSTATTLKIGYVDLGGNLDGSFVTQATAAAPTVLGVTVNASNAQFLVYWGMNSNNHVDARGFDVTKTALWASTTINSSDTGYTNIAGIWSPTANSWVVIWELAGAQNYLNLTKFGYVSNGGIASGNINWMRHSGLASKPWIAYNTAVPQLFPSTVLATGIHVLLCQDSTLQSTYFAVRLDDNSIVARLLPGTAGGVTPKAHLPQVEALTTQAGVAVDGSTGTSFGLAVLQRNRIGVAATSFDRGILDCTLVFGGQGVPRVTVGNVTYFAGGVLAEYDGVNCQEHGFLLYPENVSLAQSAGGSLTALAVYSYRFYWERVNAQGQRELSTALTFNITLTGGNQTVVATIPTLAHTMSAETNIAVYRAGPNPPATGAVYNRVSNPSAAVLGTNGFVINTFGSDTITFTDQMSDATAATQETDYLSASIIDNVAVPACTALAVSKNRAFAAVVEDADVIWPSKLRTSTNAALEWSDVLPLRVPSGPGPITGLAVISETLVVFRADRIYVTGGDGPDNTGLNGSFNVPRTLADDLGCVNGRSIVRTPAGIMFQSRKWIYLLAGDMSLQYIGADVEGFSGETIVAATLIGNVHEVRFACASGKTLVFNYLAGQWSVFTGVGGIDATLWQNRYTWLADATGKALAETTGIFQDGVGSTAPTPIVMAIETAWLHLAGLQGYQRVREVMFLGDWKSSHNARVRVAYDYEPGWVEDASLDISSVVQGEHYGDDAFYGELSATQGGLYGGNVGTAALGATSVYQFSVNFRKPKCSAMKIRIEDTPRLDPTGTNQYPLLESFRLTEIALNVGVKAGLNKVGADRSFG